MKFLIFFFVSLSCLSAEDKILTRWHLLKLSDVVFDGEFDPESVLEGAVIYVRSVKLKEFFRAFPKIKNRFVLITQGDENTPGRFSYYLKSPKIIAWFGVNPTITHEKFFSLPIGTARKVEEGLREEKIEKEHLLYFNMTIDTKTSNSLKRDERNRVLELFGDKEYCYCSESKPFDEYIRDLKKSCFVLSPRGNGIDCYRTWEAIAAGSIPIVKSSPLDSLFADLPVLIVNDWNVIDKKFLEEKFVEINNKKINWEKLYFSYWKAKIEEVKS